jgi:uncharacterized protein (DUF1778 family)
MEQINFRLKEEEKQVIQAIAEQRGISITEFAKQTVLKEIQPIRIDLAFNLLQQGKIGRKKAWIISGLNFHEFMVEWTKRNAEEFIPDEAFDKEMELLDKIDIKKYLKSNSSN